MTAKTIGRYTIIRELGRGGMAIVYLAHDPMMGRQVAIKALPPQFTFDPNFQKRFRREAKAIAALEHPVIVPVYDYGEQDGQLYLVMRYMTGGSLNERLYKGPMSLAEVVELFTGLAPGLDAAHSRGIIHRDIKPANILFDEWNKPYLSDFGIVKLVAGSDTAITLTGGIIGTPAYMSPEQVIARSELDGRSDIYALGIILYETLTGNVPYQANTPMGLAFMHVNEPIPRILEANPELPPGIQEIITRAMAKKRDERYPTASALVHDLKDLKSTFSLLEKQSTSTTVQLVQDDNIPFDSRDVNNFASNKPEEISEFSQDEAAPTLPENSLSVKSPEIGLTDGKVKSVRTDSLREETRNLPPKFTLRNTQSLFWVISTVLVLLLLGWGASGLFANSGRGNNPSLNTPLPGGVAGEETITSTSSIEIFTSTIAPISTPTLTRIAVSNTPTPTSTSTLTLTVTPSLTRTATESPASSTPTVNVPPEPTVSPNTVPAPPSETYLRNLRVIRETNNRLDMAIDYSYNGSKGVNFCIQAIPVMGEDRLFATGGENHFCPYPDYIGTGYFYLELLIDSSLTTDYIEVSMSADEGTILVETFNIIKTWSPH